MRQPGTWPIDCFYFTIKLEKLQSDLWQNLCVQHDCNRLAAIFLPYRFVAQLMEHLMTPKFVYYPPYWKISAQALLKMCRIRGFLKIITHDFLSYVKNHIKTRHLVFRRLRLKGSMSKRSSTSASRPSIDFLMSVYPNATYIFSAMLILPNMSISMQAALPQQLTEIPRQALLLLPAADVSLLIAWCQSAEA